MLRRGDIRGLGVGLEQLVLVGFSWRFGGRKRCIDGARRMRTFWYNMSDVRTPLLIAALHV